MNGDQDRESNRDANSGFPWAPGVTTEEKRLAVEGIYLDIKDRVKELELTRGMISPSEAFDALLNINRNLVEFIGELLGMR